MCCFKVDLIVQKFTLKTHSCFQPSTVFWNPLHIHEVMKGEEVVWIISSSCFSLTFFNIFSQLLRGWTQKHSISKSLFRLFRLLEVKARQKVMLMYLNWKKFKNQFRNILKMLFHLFLGDWWVGFFFLSGFLNEHYVWMSEKSCFFLYSQFYLYGIPIH